MRLDAGRHVIQTDNPLALIEESPAQVKPQEPGAAGNDGAIPILPQYNTP